MPFSTITNPQRCIKCGLLAVRLYAYGDRYICDACLPPTVLEIMPGLSVAELEEVVARIRANFSHSPVDTKRKRNVS